jgi:hypothetical protein
VSIAPRVERSKTAVPTASSSRRTRSLTAGWLTISSVAARPKLPVRATARNTSKSRISGVISKAYVDAVVTCGFRIGRRERTLTT